MKKIKYFYNTQSLRYEKLTTPLRVKFLRIFGFLSALIVSSIIIIYFYNRFFPKPADYLAYRGMILLNAQNFNVTKNQITGVVTASTATATGIAIFNNSFSGNVTSNTIINIQNTNAVGYGAVGIYLASTSTTANILTSNNFISNVAGTPAFIWFTFKFTEL